MVGGNELLQFPCFLHFFFALIPFIGFDFS